MNKEEYRAIIKIIYGRLTFEEKLYIKNFGEEQSEEQIKNFAHFLVEKHCKPALESYRDEKNNLHSIKVWGEEREEYTKILTEELLQLWSKKRNQENQKEIPQTLKLQLTLLLYRHLVNKILGEAVETKKPVRLIRGRI